MSVFVKNKAGVIHETTEEIASELVGRGDLVYVDAPKAEKTPKAEK